ncbi:hypothetical protein J4Q44_G00207250 [Coregonus suidteri]|uniref:Uncharacterized protein n=1 Tax=Coregonus suidteri TaxID=861788 RepID=A0AAN8R1V0_9TELE
MGAVEKVVAEYQEEISRSKVENDRLRRLLRITPEMKRCRTDSLQFSLTVSEKEVNPVQQHCDQEEWNSSLGTDDPEPIQIKEEEEEVGTTQVAGHLQGMEPDIVEFMFTPPWVKSDCDQDDLIQSLTLSQTKTVENRERLWCTVGVTDRPSSTSLTSESRQSRTERRRRREAMEPEDDILHPGGDCAGGGKCKSMLFLRL